MVTALRRTSTVQSAPLSIVALSGDTLAKAGATQLNDYFRQVPNLNVTAGQGGNNRISIRGVNSAGEATVGLYYDETPVTGPSGTSQDSGAVAADLNLFDVERVEVLRGPQGTLYGASSMAGTLRVIFNKPDYRGYDFASEAQVSSTHHGSMGYFFKGMINAPIVSDMLAVRLVSYYEQRPGWIDNVRFGTKNVDDQTNWGLRGLIGLKPDELTTITATLIYQKSTASDRQGWYPSVGRYKTNSPAVLPFDTEMQLYNLKADREFGFATLTATAKVTALTSFVVATLPAVHAGNFVPFAPNGWFGAPGTSGMGIVGAAASIFFAYIGFDAVSTAAEETKRPQRNIPIGLIGSLALCTVFYVLVACGAIGASGAQPVRGPAGDIPIPGSREFALACASALHAGDLVCSNEALAHVLRGMGWTTTGNLLGLAANLALPSVILMMMFGQTRIFFVMARDGLLPEGLTRIHPRFHTPHIVTMLTGAFVAFCAAILPVGQLADISNSGTLFAFFMVAIAVLVLRVREPYRERPFRTSFVWIVAPLAAIGCVFLFLNLSIEAQLVLPIWGGSLPLHGIEPHRPL